MRRPKEKTKGDGTVVKLHQTNLNPARLRDGDVVEMND